MKFDMHCHTKEGSVDGKIPLEEYMKTLMNKGFRGMLITDHNSYHGYRAYKKIITKPEYSEFVVLKGIEYDTIDAGHILIIMPEWKKLKILELRGLPVSFLIDIVHKYGGILGPAHPCGQKFLSIANTRKHKNQLAVMERFDFIETFNACESEESNKSAKELAVKFNKPEFGGSDAHRLDCVGMGYTILPKNIIRESDLITHVMKREKISSGGAYYTGTAKQKMGKAHGILVASFWFYNRFTSLLRHKKRKVELTKEGIEGKKEL